ncbi:MAG: restriction endonuclease, partial [Planctomycetes bacterium]|nr:restriction endonuclease [Planctomycetota bacterium]
VADRLIDFLNSDAAKNALDCKAPDTVRKPNQVDPDNPILDLIARQRDAIVQEMERQGVAIDESKLTDNNLIKRMVMKRCLYGVDLNPTAVELAKLSLWLHSFTLGAPLSFLDHHLHAGNSLIGFRDISQVIAPGSNAYGQFQNFMSCLHRISARADATLAEVQRDRTDFDESQIIIEPYRRRSNFRLAARGFVDMKGVNEGALESRYQNGGNGRDDHLKDSEAEKLAEVEETAAAHSFFHWELEFPEAFYDRRGRSANAGFDAVVGNPPWERMKLQEIEFFALRSPAIAAAPTAAKRRKMIADLAESDPELYAEYEHALRGSQLEMDYVRKSGGYPLLGRGDVNLYSIFVERAIGLTGPHGRTGLLTPSGIASDAGSQAFFREITKSGRLAEFIDFENKKIHFPEVHASFKFAVSIIAGSAAPQSEAQCAFFIHRLDELDDPERTFTLTPADFALLNPNTRTCPIFRTRTDAELTRKIYQAVPILINDSDEQNGNPWRIRFYTMFHMTNDSELFRTAQELQDDGFWPGADHAWHKGEETYVRLYEGKMVQMFDHRAARVVVDATNLFRPGRPEPTTPEEKADPEFRIRSHFWVPDEAVQARWGERSAEWHLGYKEITAPTNERTFILAALPPDSFNHKILLIDFQDEETRRQACALMANLSSFALDFVCRQKIGGQSLSYYLVKQLPVLPPQAYEKPFKGRDLRPWIRDRVVELTYTATDMQPFAEDMGYTGPPFIWNDQRRLHLRCQLDALYFHLYGVPKTEVAYILDTFPIVRQHDGKAHGTYRTKDLILAYYAAYGAGDLEAGVGG